MFDLGDELTVEGNRIPWLIWIQLLVLFLLFFLLYCYSVLTSDLSPASSSSASQKPFLKPTTTTVTNWLHQHNQVGASQSIKGEIPTSSMGRRIVSREDTTERETAARAEYHPCNYFRLAKLAFLKCFGLDSASENSSRSDRKKER